MPSVAGGPFGLLALLGDVARGRLQRGEVEIRGDAEHRPAIPRAAHAAAPDLEEELSLARRRRAGAPDRAACPPVGSLGRAGCRDDRCRRTRRIPRRTSAATSCRATKESNSCAAWTHCARTWTACRRALDSERAAARASREAARARAAAADPARAAQARPGRLRARHASLSAAALPVLPVARHLVRAPPPRQPRRAAAARAAGARSDLREVRPGGVHAPRPAAARHRR